MPPIQILQLCKKFPYPIKDGEVIGIINLTFGFHHHGYKTKVLALNTLKHFYDIQKLPSEMKVIADFEAVNIDTSVRIIPALKNLFGSTSYNVDRFYSTTYAQKLYETIVCQPFDMILLEGIYMMLYMDTIRKAQKDSPHNQHTPVVQRPQNVEYIIWERLAAQEKNLLKQGYLSFLAKRMKRFELDNLNKADVFIPVSQTDLDIFKSYGCKLPSVAIPTGYDFDTLPEIDVSKEENSVAFIGGMDWMPNREGVEWFLEKVWPLVLKEKPTAICYLAGRNFPSSMQNIKKQGIVIVGEVEDAKAFVQSHAVAIVPLFAGSGMRVKIIEAMAWGRAIVSTSVGAESLAYTDGKDILIADTAAQFATAVLAVLDNKIKRLSLGENAQAMIRSHYDNKKIAKCIIDFALNCK